MSLSTPTPTVMEDTTPDFNDSDAAAIGSDDAARAFPGRVRGQRLEITKADLTMYSAITGRAPSREERQRALTWSEADPMNEEIAEKVARPVSRATSSSTAILPVHALRSWHPAALSLRLRDIWFNGLTLRVNRPQISQWVRRVSLALQHGRRRVRHATR